MKDVKAGYVKDTKGRYYVQLPDDNQWGFSICDDNQTWPGGFGLLANHGVSTWHMVPEDEVPPEEQERLGWILDDFEQYGHSPWKRIDV
jgi:hypothetical protein